MSRVARRKTAILLTAVALVATLPGTASANHTWRGFHWARTTPTFTVQVGNNLSNAWGTYLNSAISDWNVSTVVKMAKTSGSSSNCRLAESIGTIQVCNDRYGNTGWLGVASVSISGKHITAATVKVNDTYFGQSTYDTSEWRNLVMCQEVGHGVGLDHQDERFTNANLNTCMDYTNSPASNQHPNAHDYEQLAKIYAHLDTTTTVAGTTGYVANAVAGLYAGQTAEAAWGKLAVASANGRGSVYVRELGRGARIVTHVFWVPEAGHEDGHRH